jgi:adenylate cyclase
MGAAGSCRACGLRLREGARFCDGCGAPTSANSELAEYKQVTVMFADVVGSMQIASAVGPERLREIMAEVLHRCTVVLARYGGTLYQFTGDGVMAVFGAPAALEDHAFLACLAALDIQDEIQRLAAEVDRGDGVALRLRVGLNSGQVVAGEIGSGPGGYTAIGEQVGMAQRMESVAPPGGIMLSEPTARLVEHAAVLGEPEWVRIKGADAAVPARRLFAAMAEHARTGRREPTLVGRAREMSTIADLLDRSMTGPGCVVGLTGPPGIGKSRTVDEAVKLAAARSVPVYSAYCESHARDVPYRVTTRLLRTVFGISDVAPDVARARVRSRLPDANPEDLLLLDDLLGIADLGHALPAITPDARLRRLASLLNAAALTRDTPAVYVIEDAHWIDEASESMLVDFVAVVPQTRSLVVITYRPEYQGALSRPPHVQTIALAPLTAAETMALTAELVGSHPSVTKLAAQIAERVAGNPFFADEIVRDLAERGVLDGDRGAYICIDAGADINVPVTVQATIAGRIDRLGANAKHSLYAGAVIGTRFRSDLLNAVLGMASGAETGIAELLRVELIDQVRYTPCAEFAFRHPLIRTVAYESQLRAGRAELHRRVAAAIEENNSGPPGQNAALIAGHLEAAGDLRAAFDWHMRAAAWSINRDDAAARISWQRARRVADRLPANEPDRSAMQIAPRTLLCGTAYRAGGSVAETGFEELQQLCVASGDKASLAIGMAGVVMAKVGRNSLREASKLASELTTLIDEIGDPALTIGLLLSATPAKFEVGEITEALRLAQRAIDAADGDPTKGDFLRGSPLALAIAMRGFTRLCLGINGWRSDADAAIAMAALVDPTSHVGAVMYKYLLAIPVGALPANTAALHETADALRVAEQTGDDFSLGVALLTRGLVLVHHQGPQRGEGLNLLSQLRDVALKRGVTMNPLAANVDLEIARENARTGAVDDAIELCRAAIEGMFDTGAMLFRGVATTVLVESLLQRGADRDLYEAESAIDRLTAVPTDPGFVLHELPVLRLRGLVARAQGDELTCRQFMERHRAKAAAAGFEPVVAAADATNPPGPPN